MSTSPDWSAQGITYTGASPVASLHSVPLSAVTLLDGFWAERFARNAERAIPQLYSLLEQHGNVDNFRLISGRKNVDRRGTMWADSEVYKWLEAVAWTLAQTDDPPLKRTADTVIDEVIAAQSPDGYLNTFWVSPRERLSDLATGHELYCLGHLIQAAVAWRRSFGDDRLLAAALRYVDLLASIFGPSKRLDAPGHPEIEMALIELFRTTDHKPSLDLAKFFLDNCALYDPSVGKPEAFIPFAERKELRGHAVREMYLCSAAADYVAATGDASMCRALYRFWDELTRSKMYVTGGVGSRYRHEGFGHPYELPNLTAYAETCAAVGLIFWAWRMLLLDGRSCYADVLETALYNGFLSGVSLQGTEYFYINPLASVGDHRRQPWHDCTCCPTNAIRLLASVAGYVYTTSAEGLWIHLYCASRLDWHLEDGTPLQVEMRTDCPRSGRVNLHVTPDSPCSFALFLRQPAWADDARMHVNSSPVDSTVDENGYIRLARQWKPGDEVTVDFEMKPRLVASHIRVLDNYDRVALSRGPLVYCLEGADNPEAHVFQVAIDPDEPIVVDDQPDLLGGVAALTASGCKAKESSSLYRTASDAPYSFESKVKLTAIPYYAWANRDPSPMLVWIPVAPS